MLFKQFNSFSPVTAVGGTKVTLAFPENALWQYEYKTTDEQQISNREKKKLDLR